MLLRTRSLAFRLVAGAAALVAAGLLVGSVSLARVFHDYVERGFDARWVERGVPESRFISLQEVRLPPS